jgi:hypothetical protein
MYSAVVFYAVVGVEAQVPRVAHQQQSCKEPEQTKAFPKALVGVLANEPCAILVSTISLDDCRTTTTISNFLLQPFFAGSTSLPTIHTSTLSWIRWAGSKRKKDVKCLALLSCQITFISFGESIIIMHGPKCKAHYLASPPTGLKNSCEKQAMES